MTDLVVLIAIVGAALVACCTIFIIVMQRARAELLRLQEDNARLAQSLRHDQQLIANWELWYGEHFPKCASLAAANEAGAKILSEQTEQRSANHETWTLVATSNRNGDRDVSAGTRSGPTGTAASANANA